MAVLSPIAFFYIFPTLVIHADAPQTIQNIGRNPRLFLLGIGCYLMTFVADVVVAWALYFFFAPVNRAVEKMRATRCGSSSKSGGEAPRLKMATTLDTVSACR